MYKFKEIKTVPASDNLIDIVLSKTQRHTPTVVHPGYKITRIRNFYLRKIKFVQTTFSEKLTAMMTEFPRLDEIHPFFADLCNVLYDRDHFKLALGQVSTTKNIIDNCAKDYVRMMKFADSLYRCKMLKRAALGRMCTAIKKMDAALKYLEEVRQHLGRLPAINPTTRTLLLTGFPNVGKSSFMNTVTKANVDTQPYAFTTKSLFVGHMDYQYTRWQVIDTPGILDHPLEERNTIEMTAITALAHIQAAILYFFDLSETCGYTLAQQVSLFKSIKPMFRNRPLLVLLNKADLRRSDDLSEEEKALLKECEAREDEEGAETHFFTISTATKEGVDEARTKACELLLAKRVDAKIEGGNNSAKVEKLANRMHVVTPQAPLTGGSVPAVASQRPVFIPDSVLRKRAAEQAASSSSAAGAVPTVSPDGYKNEKQLQEEFGGAGVYAVDLNKSYDLKNNMWKYDEIPQVMDGANIMDFLDPEIEAKMAALEERERADLIAEGLGDVDEVLKSWADTEAEIDKMHSCIRTKQLLNRDGKTLNKMGQKIDRRKIRSLKDVTEHLKNVVTTNPTSTDVDAPGFDVSARARKRARSASTAGIENRRGRSRNAQSRGGDDAMDVDADGNKKTFRKKSSMLRHARSASAGATASTKVKGLSVLRNRSLSRVAQSISRPELQEKSEMKRRKFNKKWTDDARRGEGDRQSYDWKPKHLYSGKRGNGKTDRR